MRESTNLIWLAPDAKDREKRVAMAERERKRVCENAFIGERRANSRMFGGVGFELLLDKCTVPSF